MKKMVSIVALTALCGQSAMATTKEDVVAFVKEGAAYAKANGNEKAFDEFSNPKGKFSRGELYLYVYEYGADDKTCINRAHGLIPDMRKTGKDACGTKDKNGVYLNRELMKAAKGGGGFVEFLWPHPQTKAISKKIGYAIDLDGKHFIGSGFYPTEK